jgi:hypothetical protein
MIAFFIRKYSNLDSTKKTKVMKKPKKLIGRSIFAGLIALCFFFACRKENSTNQVSTGHQPGNQTLTAQRGTGTQTFYSTDDEGTFYRLDLIWGTNGALEIDRTVVTSYPDETGHVCLLEEGIDYDEDGDTVSIVTPSGLTYYHIPFSPGADLGAISGGGTTHYYCQSNCNDNTKSCGMEILVGGSGPPIMKCSGTCNRCVVVSNKCPSSASGWDPLITNPGSILVEASSISIIH